MNINSLSNRFRIFHGYFLGGELPIYPTAMYVEPTNKCNLGCPMCPHGKMGRPQGLMDFGLFKGIADAMAGQVEVMLLHFMGESLIHPKLPEMVAYAHERGIFTQMSTNGTLLSGEAAKALFEAGLDVLSIDFDGETPDGYEAVRPHASLGKVLVNVRGAVAAKARLGSRCAIALQVIMFPGQKGDLTDFLGLEELKAVEVRRKIFNDSFNTDGRPVAHKRPCFHLWNDMTVAWDGTVPLCCVDYDCQVDLGNLGESSIREIWNGEKIRELRRRHLAIDCGLLPMCASCTLPNQAHYNPVYVAASLVAGPRLSRKLMTPALGLLRIGKIFKLGGL